MLLEREVLMITIANPEKYVAGLYERLSNENIEVGNGEVIVSNEDERKSGSISTQKLFLRNFCKENNMTTQMTDILELPLTDQTSIE